MLKVYPAVFKGTIQAPPSKAYAQRLLFAASMPNVPTLVKNVPDCEDIDTTEECLTAFGCNIKRQGKTGRIVEPFVKTNPLQTINFNFRQSATTSRLALPLAAALGIKAICKASGTLPKRQLVPLTGRMALRGVTFSNFNFPLQMQGRLDNGEFIFHGDEGSQYISGLLLALPLLSGPSTIRLSSPLVDKTFVDVSVSTLQQFGIRIDEVENGYNIQGRQQYISPGEVKTENDWGIASLWLTAGCLSRNNGGRIVVNGLPKDSPQMYRDIMPTLSLLSSDFEDMTIDAKECPNLTTLFAVTAAGKAGTVRIDGVPQLKNKETNRLKAIADCLRILGAAARDTNDGIVCMGRSDVNYTEDTVVDCQNDPWIFMSLAVGASVFEKPFIITDEKCVNKIYPNFLQDYKALGGKYKVL